MTRQSGLSTFASILIHSILFISIIAAGPILFSPASCLAEISCNGDHNLDGDVDGDDLADLIAGAVDPAAVAALAGSFGHDDCEAPDVVELVGSSGGQIQTADNITVTIPAGAVDAPTYIGVAAISETDLSAPIPPTFTLAAGIRLFTGGVELSIPAHVSLPPAETLEEGRQIVVTQEIPDSNGDGFDDCLLVDRAVHQSGLIETQSQYFLGLVGSGNFMFLKTDRPVAYVAMNNIADAAGQPLNSGQLRNSSIAEIPSWVKDGIAVALMAAGIEMPQSAVVITDDANDQVFGFHLFDNLHLTRDEVRLVEDLIEVKDSPAEVKQRTRTYVAVKEENVAPGTEFMNALNSKFQEKMSDLQEQLVQQFTPLAVYESTRLVLEKDKPGSITADLALLKDKFIPLKSNIAIAIPEDNISFTVPEGMVTDMLATATGTLKKVLDLVVGFFGDIESAPVTIQILNALVESARIQTFVSTDFVPTLTPNVNPFAHTMSTDYSGDTLTVTLTTGVTGTNVADIGMKLPATFELDIDFAIQSSDSQCHGKFNHPMFVVTPTVDVRVAEEVSVNVDDMLSAAEAMFTLPGIAVTSSYPYLDMSKVSSNDDLHYLDYSIRVECPDVDCNGLDETTVVVTIDGQEQTGFSIVKGTDTKPDQDCEDDWESMCSSLESDIFNCEAGGWFPGTECDFEPDPEWCWYCEGAYDQWITECSSNPCTDIPYTYLTINLANVDLALDDPHTPGVNEGHHILAVLGQDGNGHAYHLFVGFNLPSIIWKETWDFRGGSLDTCLGHPVAWNMGVEAHLVVYGSFEDVNGGLWGGWTYGGGVSQECAWMDDPYYKNLAYTADGICMAVEGPAAWNCSDLLELIHYDGDYFNYHDTVYGVYIDPGIDAYFACDVNVARMLLRYFKPGPGGLPAGGYAGTADLWPGGPFDVSLRAVAPLPFPDLGFYLVSERLYISEGSTLGPCMLYVK
jgi:hypothetical protein